MAKLYLQSSLSNTEPFLNDSMASSTLSKLRYSNPKLKHAELKLLSAAIFNHFSLLA